MEKFSESTFLALPAHERDHSLGDRNAATVIVVYGDYESAKSAAAHRILLEAQARIGADNLRIVYRHFPLGDERGRGWLAAEAAAAAGAQNLFWEMHERLFANENQLDNGFLVEHAVAVGVVPGQFLRDIAAHVHAAHVRECAKSGADSGVENVPAIFINNVRYEAEEFNLDELIQVLNG